MRKLLLASLLRFPMIFLLICICLMAIIEAVVLFIPALLSALFSEKSSSSGPHWPKWYLAWTNCLYLIVCNFEAWADEFAE